MDPFIKLLLVLACGAVLAVALRLLSRRKTNPSVSPYLFEPSLLTPAERSFFGVLESVVGSQYRIMAKVRLGDILKVRPGLSRAERQSAWNRIQSKHVDFVLCRPSDLSIAAVIELDDSSHNQPERASRDAFLADAFSSAGVTLLRFSVKRVYTVQDVAAALDGLGQSATEIVQTPDNTITHAPRCPQCGAPLVLRTSKRGNHAGEQFWGCTNYPNCKGMYVDSVANI